MKEVGLFFGSFNPVHVGHMVLANYMLEFTPMDELWFVVSPHNPLKEKSGLLDVRQRIQMVDLAIGGHPGMKSSSIETKLPQPSYTIHTLTHLSEKFPNFRFSLIMGSDNLESLHKWKNYEQILNKHKIYVYPRPGHPGGQFLSHRSVSLTSAPFIEISSTFIREGIKAKLNMEYFVGSSVWSYLEEMNFYKK
jgi:nicotinate-nucleotide adenylyltransferase